jgi:hypothetical protein
MKNKKLRMVDLLNLVKSGRYDEIPEGYKIEWFGGAPGEAFKFDVTDKDITILRNINAPKPTKLTLVGEYVPFFPLYGNLLEEVDYGTVIIRTNLELKTIAGVYDMTKVSGRQLMEFIRKSAETVTGRCINKEEATFDMRVNLPESKGYVDIFNLFPTDVEFPGFDCEEDIKEIHAKFICDYFQTHFEDFYDKILKMGKK